MKVYPSDKSRQFVLRAAAGERLPEALVRGLGDHAVTGGWLRGSGVLDEVEIRAYRAEAGGLGASRRLAGALHAIVLEGSIGATRSELTVGMRVVFARETELGVETIAGELVAARVVALEAHVIAFDDLATTRAHDAHGGVWLLEDAHAVAHFTKPRDASAPDVGARPSRPPPAEPATWAEAAAVSAEANAPPPPTPEARKPGLRVPPAVDRAVAPAGTGAPIPARLAKPVRVEEETVLPEAGDVVEHFAFGRCEVFKSDGERLHIRVLKDGRVREIALEMLRVSQLPPEGERRHFKLERKL